LVGALIFQVRDSLLLVRKKLHFKSKIIFFLVDAVNRPPPPFDGMLGLSVFQGVSPMTKELRK
jgi:hypothetical protein